MYEVCLDTIIRKAEAMDSFEIGHLIEYVREYTLSTIEEILRRSSNECDCVQQMSASIDDFAINILKYDKFLREFPKRELQDLKEDLKPIFCEAYGEYNRS